MQPTSSTTKAMRNDLVTQGDIKDEVHTGILLRNNAGSCKSTSLLSLLQVYTMLALFVYAYHQTSRWQPIHWLATVTQMHSRVSSQHGMQSFYWDARAVIGP